MWCNLDALLLAGVISIEVSLLLNKRRILHSHAAHHLYRSAIDRSLSQVGISKFLSKVPLKLENVVTEIIGIHVHSLAYCVERMVDKNLPAMLVEMGNESVPCTPCIVAQCVAFKAPGGKQCAGVDLKEYGIGMLKAGAGIGDMTPAEIAKTDLKEFQFGDYHVIISQISVMDPQEVLDIEPQLIEAMSAICEKEGFDMSLVMVTDILQEATYLMYAGSPKTLIGEAFKQDASGTHIYLPGVMSRKKQIVPPLSEAVKRIAQN